jgi:hypothetical protein
VGWAPKEFNQAEDNSDQQTVDKSGMGAYGGGCSETENTIVASTHTSPQSGFVWDEASGYYYDAASGFIMMAIVGCIMMVTMVFGIPIAMNHNNILHL